MEQPQCRDHNISLGARVNSTDVSKIKRGRDVSTIKGLIDEYIESYAKPQKTSWHSDLRMLNKDVLPKWKYLATAHVTPRDVTKLMHRLIAQGSGTSVNKILNLLQSVFAFAVSQGLIDTDPCAGLSAPIETSSKDRVFNKDEVKKFWHGLKNAKMPEGMKLSLKLILLTGQRNGEVIGSKWEEFDLREKWWTIPPTRTKNKKKHRVYLTKMTLDVLQEAKKIGAGSDWVFPSSKEKPISSREVSRAIKNNCENKSKGQSKQKQPYGDAFNIGLFTPNDLRRTTANLMAKAGMDASRIANVLNQSTATLENVNVNDSQKRQSLIVWERQLQTLLFSWVKPRSASASTNK
jgi:integrase